MNHKGFTLIEVLGVFAVLGILIVFVLGSVGSTVSIGKNDAYKLMKKNIISVSYDYVNECVNHVIECDFSFSDNNRFSAKVLEDIGYFKNMKSPIDGKDLGECLFLEAKKENGVVVVDLFDECY